MTLSIAQHLKDSADVKMRFVQDTAAADRLASEIISALRRGNKLVTFGNGGSAADAQHFAAELVGRFETDRPALAAVSLTTDTSALTSIANDFSFDDVFSRQVQGIVREGDVVVGISTSGNSKNVLKGLEEAKKRKAWTAAMTGMTGGQLKAVADCCIMAPSPRTAHIQECHIALIHAICTCIDAAFITARA